MNFIEKIKMEKLFCEFFGGFEGLGFFQNKLKLIFSDKCSIFVQMFMAKIKDFRLQF
jgi:hypothetical protein